MNYILIIRWYLVKEASVYASIRQGKAKAGMAEELARRIKEGAIPIISDVEGFRAYYVVYAPDDTVTAISIFNDYAGAEESINCAGVVTRGSKEIEAYGSSLSTASRKGG
jgi:hypothetical protein